MVCCLILNVNKRKEIITDFRRSRNNSNTISIMAEKMEVVEEKKYLGILQDHTLDWRCNTYVTYKKGPKLLEEA